jgi:hypothetical protein
MGTATGEATLAPFTRRHHRARRPPPAPIPWRARLGRYWSTGGRVRQRLHGTMGSRCSLDQPQRDEQERADYAPSSDASTTIGEHTKPRTAMQRFGHIEKLVDFHRRPSSVCAPGCIESHACKSST